MTTNKEYRHPDDPWPKIQAGGKWLTPEEDVKRGAGTLAPGARILDLGAGIGRHALWLAAQGFDVFALDPAPEGPTEIDRAGSAETVESRMRTLPFDDHAFDHVLSWKVIYHGDKDILLRIIAKIRRVLKPGGSYLGTMLSKRRLPSEIAKYPGREISTNAWVFEVPGTHNIHPLYFCSAADLLALFSGFECRWLEDREHEKPGSWHWHLVMERL